MAYRLGDNLVTNGGFDADSDWTTGGAWAIAGGVATCDVFISQTHRLQQDIAGLVMGQFYLIELTVSTYTRVGANNVYSLDSAFGIANMDIDGAGNWSFTLPVVESEPAADIDLTVPSQFLVGSEVVIDNYSIRAITPVTQLRANGLPGSSVSFSAKAETEADTGFAYTQCIIIG